MYKLIFNKTVVKSDDLRLLYGVAKYFFENTRSAHYQLYIKEKRKRKRLIDWSCSCWRKRGSKIPSFEY